MSRRTRDGRSPVSDFFRFAFHTVLVILLSIFALSSIILIAESVLPGDRMPGLLRPSAVNSATMAPTVRRGDFILLGSSGDRFEKGDVISYSTEEGFALGRIVGMVGSDCLVKGDAEPDTAVVRIEKERIRGVWSGFRIPWLGYPILWIRTAPGFVLSVLAILLIILMVSAFSRKKRRIGDACEAEVQGVGASLCASLLLLGSIFLTLWIQKNKRDDRRARK